MLNKKHFKWNITPYAVNIKTLFLNGVMVNTQSITYPMLSLFHDSILDAEKFLSYFYCCCSCVDINFIVQWASKNIYRVGVTYMLLCISSSPFYKEENILFLPSPSLVCHECIAFSNLDYRSIFTSILEYYISKFTSFLCTSPVK